MPRRWNVLKDSKQCSNMNDPGMLSSLQLPKLLDHGAKDVRQAFHFTP